MLRISQNTLQELKQEKISELTVRIISGGCAGSKIEVLTSLPEIMNDFKSFSIKGIELYIPKDQQKELIGGLLTRGPKGWLFTHPDIKSRCGCATSFSYEKKGKIPSLHVLKDLKKKFTKSKNQ